MRKVAEVTTPKRGRPPKKHLITPKSAPAVPGEASIVPQNGTKLSDVQVSSKQTNTSASHKQNLNINKRNGSRSASVDSSGTISKKRRLQSPDKAAGSSGKTSMPSSRASSKEKVTTLLSKTVKQEALKVAQRLESPPTRISNRGKILAGLETSRKKKTQLKKLITKSQKSKPIKKLKNDLKSTNKTEIKRLSTTMGFWSFKTSSRSNSPLGQPLVETPSQKQTHSVKKDSRTSTPDISPSCTKRQSIAKMRTDKEEAATPKPNIPVSELRRLRTTEGFSFRDSALAGSRDVSPSSASSLDRVIRQNARPLNRSNENKNGAKSCDIDQNIVTAVVQRKPKIKSKKALDDDDNKKLPEHQIVTAEIISVNSSTVSGEQTSIESPISRFRKKKKSISEQPAKQDKFSSSVRGRKASSFVRGFNRRQRLTVASVLPDSVTGEPMIDPLISTSISTPGVKEEVRLTTRSGIRKIIKNSPKESRAGLKRVKYKLKKTVSPEPLKSSGDLGEEYMNVSQVDGEIAVSDSGNSVKACSSPEFVISDLLGSAELKRLNTTAGFWASTPDIGTVLATSHPRRLRDADINSIKGSSDNVSPKQPEQAKELPKFQKSSVKSQSTLLQHRKKRLHALQNSLRKIKQQISNDELVDQHQLLDNMSPPTAEVPAKQKPNPKTCISTKKRSYKTRSKPNGDQDKILEEVQACKEHYETAETEVDIKESSGTVDLKMDTIETLEAIGSEICNKEPHESSGPETSTSVTDSLPSKKMFVKTWRRGRRKLIPGDAPIHSANFSSVKTRGRGRVDSSAKSLEVLQNLEPNREGKLFSTSHDTPKVGRERTKLKRAKKESFSESSLSMHIPDIDVDMLPPQGTEALQEANLEESKDCDVEQESCSRIASTETDNVNIENHPALLSENEGHKKDNLFESLGYDLIKPTDVPCLNPSSDDVSVDTPLSLNIVESQVIKSDLPTLADNCDQTPPGICELGIRASATAEPDSVEICTNSEESVKLDVTDIKVVLVNKESFKAIPIQADSITPTPSHDAALPDLSVVPKKWQSLDESLVITTELNLDCTDSKNDITVADETVCECDTSPVQQVKETIPFKVTVISENEQSPLEELDIVDNTSHLADKASMEICTADNLELCISGNDNSEEVKDTSNEIEQIIESEDSSLNHCFNVENKSIKCIQETELELEAEATSQQVDIMPFTSEDSTKDFNQPEQLQNLFINNDQSLKSEEEKHESFIVETLNFNIEQQDKILDNGSELINDISSMVSVDTDPNSSGEDKAVENIVLDISAAPFEFSHNGDVSTLHTADTSAETVGLKQQQKRKKRTTRFIRHNLYTNSDIVSHSVLDNQVPEHILDKTGVTAEIAVGDQPVVNTLSTKHQFKKMRKRRRNAWQRGVLKKTNLSRKTSKQGWLLNSEKTNTPARIVTSLIEGESTTSIGLQNENSGNQETESYSPAIKKSLSNMLKKLQTNANLANAVLVEKPYKGRFLRNVHPQEQKVMHLKMKRKKLNADLSDQHNIDTTKSLSGDSIDEFKIEIPKDLNVSGTVKRKRGRPKKQRDESFPKLTPLHNLPTLRPVTPWNKTPPNLSPQTITLQSSVFFDTEELKDTPDAEFVCESVDNTDLHLYLSGVSDEEQSPKKESLLVFDTEIQTDIPLYQEKKCDDNSELETVKESALSIEDTPAAQKSVQDSGKESEKMIKPKFRGRKGCPPGIPMTEEERRKKVQKTLLSLETYEEQDLVESLGMSQKSILAPDVCDHPVFIGKIDTPAAKFSLRKKSTRSPLEMIAMKRKQEEARYDLEQEKRQARLIHLREMRSARESGDGFSDDGDVIPCPENLNLCSVILSDFVKKLQLDDIDASSCEEVPHQPAENLGANGDSPDYNGDEEDWCADLEHESEDRNDNRPYIPRLKLKRVIKKGMSSYSKRINLKKQQPGERHEPIKLVIKAEPSLEQSEQVGVKSSSFVDSAKLDQSTFENSFMDFLRGKHESEKAAIPKRKYNISKHTNIEGKKQTVTDLSSAEIITLPIPMFRDSTIRVDQNSLTEVDKTASVNEHQPEKSFVNVVSSKSHLSDLDALIKSADKLPSVENVEATKRLLSVDEEDDDILILDLDDGAVDHNSEDTFRDSLPQLLGSPFSSAPPLIPGKINTPKGNEIVSKEKNITSPDYPAEENSVDNGVLRSTYRSYSNDEMGLMFESYNSQKDQGVDSHSDAEQNVAINSASSEKFENCSENRTVTQISEISHSVTSILMEGDTVHRNTVSDIHQLELITDNADEPSLLSPETNIKDTSNVLDNNVATAAICITNKDTLNVDHLDGQTEARLIQQFEGGNKETEQTFMGKVSMNAEDATSEEAINLPHSESLAATSEKIVEDCTPDIASLDNNNISQTFKSVPKVSAPVKKPGLSSDNSKSPKHSTYYGSGPEEWKLKVILQSDKFSSGKYSCKRCGFTTPSKLTIESHIYSHIPGVQFRCAYCESEFSSMAATSTHLKNTHSLSEAKLHISRYIDEKNFYDKEAAVFSDENGQHSTAQASTNSGGQSPPVIISVVVSGGVGSSRSGRPSAPPRRFVCTHCGFSTNVKEDAEHHVLDLHSSQSLFACLLCSENVCYTESEIKDHSATVHPARHHPYRKLPDFYDAEQLSLKEKAVSQDDRENIFERMSSMFQDDSQTSTGAIDHRQKAKEYLYLQEGWREKTRVEADSTTAVDYTEEPSAPQTPTQECSTDESSHQAEVTENEASGHHMAASQAADVVTCNPDLSETATLSDDAFITSSAGSEIKISSVNSQVVDSGDSSEPPGQQAVEGNEETLRQLEEPEAPVDDNIQESCQLSPRGIEDNDDDSEGMGLKIIQVVSLSEQGEDLDEQISSDQLQPEEVDPDVPAESSGICQTVARPSESTTGSSADAQDLLAPRHSSASNEEIVVQKDIQTQNAVKKLKGSSKSDVPTDSPIVDTSAASSSAASPSFAGGLPLSYKCNACKVHTPYLLMMVKHLKARHPNMRCFSCPYCKTTHSFVSQKQLRHHVKQSHPNKFGRNEIALSEDAKKFVEAMVLPTGPECIRVGSRIVLEEDIHTCTYCQVKMISLASVYEHLNTKHSDLFEFVCPVCQNFKNKMLTEISEHCLKTHKSSLDTDKVHVSVPKNLFTALTCISKNGKYIEKNLVSGAVAGNVDKASGSSSSAASELPQKAQAASIQGKVSHVLGASPMENLTPATVHSPLRLTSFASTPTAPAGVALVSATQTNQPIFALPLISAGIGVVPAARTVVAFSSSLFDTSSIAATPHIAITSQPTPVIHNAAASSFLSPLPQPAHLNSLNTQSSKQQPLLQMHPRSNERAHGPVKNLPVLNVPTIKPRASSLATKSVVAGRRADDHNLSDKVPKSIRSTSSSIASLLTTSPSQLGMRPTSSSSCLDNLPDDEPNPDAFKIFNLRPSGSLTSSSSASPTVSPGVPAVFPPVSSPITSGYLQGPIAGFPPGMIIPSNLLPLSFSFAQHQPLMQGMLAQKHNQRSSPLSRHPRHPSSASMIAQSSITQHEPTTAATVFLKKQQQQRELYLLKKQHQLLRQNHQQSVPRAHPAHQQPPSLSGQVYQPLPIQPLSFDQRPPPGLSDFSQSSLFPSTILVSSTSTVPSSSAQPTIAHSSSPSRPSKGVHKRSSSLYQCPYCPVLVTLKALEVASHIQQNHPGKQVAFRKIA